MPENGMKGFPAKPTTTTRFDEISPLTTRGDILLHDGTNNVRIPKGSDGDVLTMDGDDPTWTAPTAAPDTSDGAVQYADIDITNAEMLALHATPKELAPAPGAGKVVEVISVGFFFDWTANYTNLGDKFRIHFASSAVNLAEADYSGFLDASGDAYMNTQNEEDDVYLKAACDNRAVQLTNDDNGAGALTGGDAANVVRVRIAYRVLSAGW